jgi:hypothetical protein
LPHTVQGGTLTRSSQGTAVSETKEFRKEFITEVVDRSACNTIATEIVCYRGDSSNPRWTDSEPGWCGYILIAENN